MTSSDLKATLVLDLPRTGAQFIPYTCMYVCMYIVYHSVYIHMYSIVSVSISLYSAWYRILTLYVRMYVCIHILFNVCMWVYHLGRRAGPEDLDTSILRMLPLQRKRSLSSTVWRYCYLYIQSLTNIGCSS